jgi:hypothetical protein
MEDNLINTKDLILYTVKLAEYELLQADYAHPKHWLNRGFSDPYKYFLNNRNPIPIPRFNMANWAPYIRSRICSGVNSVEIALCDGHIADWPIAHTVVTKKACGIVFTRLSEQ